MIVIGGWRYHSWFIFLRKCRPALACSVLSTIPPIQNMGKLLDRISRDGAKDSASVPRPTTQSASTDVTTRQKQPDGISPSIIDTDLQHFTVRKPCPSTDHSLPLTLNPPSPPPPTTSPSPPIPHLQTLLKTATTLLSSLPTPSSPQTNPSTPPSPPPSPTPRATPPPSPSCSAATSPPP